MANNKNSKDEPRKVSISNRRARFDFEIVDRFEAGVQLSGSEAKSLRNGGGSLVDAYAMERKGQLYIVGMHITPYDKAGYERPDPYRERKLLMHRREIDKLLGQVATKGMTLVPTRVYFNARGWAKVEVGLARGKKQYDKRESIKKRDQERDIARDFKTR